MKRGDIYYADMGAIVGSEQGGIRPIVIIQNDIGNKHSPTVIAAVVTTRKTKHKLPTHCWLEKSSNNLLPKDSMVMLEQIKTLDKRRLTEYCGHISKRDKENIDKALKISLGIKE